MAHFSLRKPLEMVSRGGDVFARFILVVMMLLICADVFGRYVIRHPIVGAYEVAEFFMSTIVFVALAYTQLQKANVSVDLVYERLPPKVQSAMAIFNTLLALGLFLLITWLGSADVLRALELNDRTAGLVRLPLWPAKAMVPLGSGLLCLQFITDIWDRIHELFPPGRARTPS